MTSFSRIATVTASTKAPAALDAQGRRGGPTLYLTGVRCTPLDSADSQQARDLAFRLQGEQKKMISLLQTYTDGDQDIAEGDVLVVGEREYPIRNISDWEWRGSRYLALLVEDEKPMARRAPLVIVGGAIILTEDGYALTTEDGTILET